MEENRSKKWYQKWWIWLIIIIFLLWLLWFLIFPKLSIEWKENTGLNTMKSTNTVYTVSKQLGTDTCYKQIESSGTTTSPQRISCNLINYDYLERTNGFIGIFNRITGRVPKGYNRLRT